MAALVAVETVVLVLLVVLVAGLLRSHADIVRALHALGVRLGPEETQPVPPDRSTPVAGPLPREPLPGPGGDERRGRPVGRPAPDLVGESPEGATRSVAVAGTGRDVLLAFLSSGCGTCAGFWAAFGEGRHHGLGGTRIVAVTRDPTEESASALRRLQPAEDVAVVMSSAAWEDYAVPGSPYFVYVEATTGRVAGEGTAARWDQLLSLCRQARDDGASVPHQSGSWLTGAEREARADRELAAAGIQPGDPSLYPPLTEPGEA